MRFASCSAWSGAQMSGIAAECCQAGYPLRPAVPKVRSRWSCVERRGREFTGRGDRQWDPGTVSETRNRGGHGGSVAEPDAAGGESCRQKGVATSICNTIETRPQTQATLRSLNGHLPYPAPSGAPGTDAVRGPGVHIGPGRSALRLSAGIGESASAPSKTCSSSPGQKLKWAGRPRLQILPHADRLSGHLARLNPMSALPMR